MFIKSTLIIMDDRFLGVEKQMDFIKALVFQFLTKRFSIKDFPINKMIRKIRLKYNKNETVCICSQGLPFPKEDHIVLFLYFSLLLLRFSVSNKIPSYYCTMSFPLILWDFFLFLTFLERYFSDTIRQICNKLLRTYRVLWSLQIIKLSNDRHLRF